MIFPGAGALSGAGTGAAGEAGYPLSFVFERLDGFSPETIYRCDDLVGFIFLCILTCGPCF